MKIRYWFFDPGIQLPLWIVLIVVSSVVIAMAEAVNDTLARRACLAAGYPDARPHLFFTPNYCIKRVNQSDVVVPLDSVRRR